jgi:hypothetical protein
MYITTFELFIKLTWTLLGCSYKQYYHVLHLQNTTCYFPNILDYLNQLKRQLQRKVFQLRQGERVAVLLRRRPRFLVLFRQSRAEHAEILAAPLELKINQVGSVSARAGLRSCSGVLISPS